MVTGRRSCLCSGTLKYCLKLKYGGWLETSFSSIVMQNKTGILEPLSVCVLLSLAMRVFYCHWLCLSNGMKVAVFQPKSGMAFKTGNLTALTNEVI